MSLYPHHVGFECEIDGVNINHITPVLVDRHLWNYSGESDEPEAHYNHCDCDACTWGASLLRPHYDCTCDGEIVSDILEWPSPESEALLTELAYILSAAGVQPGKRAGFHVHVEHNLDDLDDRYSDDAWCWECDTEPRHCDCGEYGLLSYDTDQRVQKMTDYFTWYEQQIAVFAKQSLDTVRNYNHWLSSPEPSGVRRFVKHDMPPSKGMTLALRDETWEFRIWNSVTEAWRMHLAIEMSCAFVEAVKNAPPIGMFPPADRPPLVTFLAPYLSDAGLAYVARHLAT